MEIRCNLLKLAVLTILALPFFTTSAFAWGCKGHQTVALIAEKHLTPEARQFLDKLLNDNAIDPQLKRFCGNYSSSLLADGATWPDDIRNTARNGSWHYIDIPRRSARAPLASFCGESGCITQAIAAQLATLKDGHADPHKRADAVRYLVHFVGDLHMPLHASTNNDEGGNCVPVQYFRRKPHERNHSYVPNLHALWDTTILEHDMEGADPAEYAEFLEDSFRDELPGWKKAGVDIEDWAWESHELAETYAYGQLTPKDPVETPAAVHACTDDNNVGGRLLNLHFVADAHYQEVAAPIVEKRIAQAGIRLALLLNEAVKSLEASN